PCSPSAVVQRVFPGKCLKTRDSRPVVSPTWTNRCRVGENACTMLRALGTPMRTRAMLTAACLAAVWMVAPARARTTDTALERAFFDWDRGDYVAALTTYRDVLAGADAAAALEPIALQTGELFHTTELTRDGANPRFSG